MEVQTFRARSMQEALEMVRRTLGPDAAVLQTREIGRGALPWLTGWRDVEVMASTGIPVPQRFPEFPASAGVAEDAAADLDAGLPPGEPPFDPRIPPAHRLDYRAKFRQDLKTDPAERHSLVEQLAAGGESEADLETGLLGLYQALIAGDMPADTARQWVRRVQGEATDEERANPAGWQACATRLIAGEIACSAPWEFTPGVPRVVALIGPTGVGKTTTVAKLAANYRLRERRRVGLITADNYRIAAVEQLRTYAEIIDLPLEVVSTPREMRRALDSFSGLELILVDTAGRSPSDELRLQELRSLLLAAHPDDVYLVLSAVCSAVGLVRTAARFRPLGATALLLTKLDEAECLGNVLPLLQGSSLPLGFVASGPSVPDDLTVPDRQRLAQRMVEGR